MSKNQISVSAYICFVALNHFFYLPRQYFCKSSPFIYTKTSNNFFTFGLSYPWLFPKFFIPFTLYWRQVENTKCISRNQVITKLLLQGWNLVCLTHSITSKLYSWRSYTLGKKNKGLFHFFVEIILIWHSVCNIKQKNATF